jgi:hypothetical protein
MRVAGMRQSPTEMLEAARIPSADGASFRTRFLPTANKSTTARAHLQDWPSESLAVAGDILDGLIALPKVDPKPLGEPAGGNGAGKIIPPAAEVLGEDRGILKE